MRVLGVIPARYASSRFPGKPLAEIHGKSMIQRVYDQAVSAGVFASVVVATDDERIFDHVNSFGGMVLMTLPSHESGTERCLEVLQKAEGEYDAVVNIQGDEPYIHPEQLQDICEIIARPDVEIATLVKRIQDADTILNPNRVKVVMNDRNEALYFSRSPIPHAREHKIEDWLGAHDYYKHIGLYAYTSETLNEIVHMEPGMLERTERLEQLRWLERGKRIVCGFTRHDSFGVDTPDDLVTLLREKPE